MKANEPIHQPPLSIHSVQELRARLTPQPRLGEDQASESPGEFSSANGFMTASANGFMTASASGFMSA